MTQQIEDRVVRLEAMMHRWKLTTMVALVVLATLSVVIVMRDRAKAEVRAHAFLLVNGSDEVIARLADSPGGP
jgi:hypothetical protein